MGAFWVFVYNSYFIYLSDYYLFSSLWPALDDWTCGLMPEFCMTGMEGR